MILITRLLNTVLIFLGEFRCQFFPVIDKHLTVLWFGSQVIAVILAVSLHHANGRAITSTSKDNIGRMLDLAEEELNTFLNETNANLTEREENQADVLKLSESDSSSAEEVQSQIRSDNMIEPKEASPVLRQKRSHQGPCYSGNYQTVRLASGGLAAFPICRKVSLTGCASALSSNQQGKRLCVASLTTVLIRRDDGTTQLRAFAQSCSCAA